MSMTNRDIFNNALVFIGESSTSENIADYEERAPYLLASFCSLTKATDKSLRKAEGLEEQPSFSPVVLSLSGTFPLCDRLSPIAAVYVAAMLVIDEDADLSDSLYDKYCDSIASLSAGAESASFENGSTVQKYFSN